jgi:subtilisin family serine protease
MQTSRPKALNRKHVLTAFAVALLSACGGGDDDSSPPPQQQPASCEQGAAASQAQAKDDNRRLIAKLKPGADLSAMFSATASAASAASTGAKQNATTMQGMRLRKLVEMKDLPRARAAGAASDVSSATANAVGAPRFASLELTDPSLSLESAKQRLRDSGQVEYVEIDARMTPKRAPSDSLYSQGWHLNNNGTYTDTQLVRRASATGFDIDAQLAWDRGVGTGSSVVAIVDTGTQTNHPDLAANLWRNSGEIANNGIDDDRNGIADDVHGADMVLGLGSVEPYGRADDDHGTNVAGVIAARGDNGTGTTGVAWNTKIMSLKIAAPDTDSYFVSDFIDAFNYALTQKANGVNVRVINVSYVAELEVNAFREVIDAANRQGILVVVPSGNDGSTDVACLGYPAAWRLPNVLTVGASNPNGQLAVFSNFGSLTNLYAPGEAILTTSSFSGPTSGVRLLAPGYRVVSGTSFSAPVVAGAAALLMDTYPSASMSAVRARLIASATPFSSNLPHLNLANAIATSP